MLHTSYFIIYYKYYEFSISFDRIYTRPDLRNKLRLSLRTSLQIASPRDLFIETCKFKKWQTSSCNNGNVNRSQPQQNFEISDRHFSEVS